MVCCQTASISHDVFFSGTHPKPKGRSSRNGSSEGRARWDFGRGLRRGSWTSLDLARVENRRQSKRPDPIKTRARRSIRSSVIRFSLFRCTRRVSSPSSFVKVEPFRRGVLETGSSPFSLSFSIHSDRKRDRRIDASLPFSTFPRSPSHLGSEPLSLSRRDPSIILPSNEVLVVGMDPSQGSLLFLGSKHVIRKAQDRWVRIHRSKRRWRSASRRFRER